eukprot:TRINITY_DN42681_c0_g1_i1.p1 TRINITY_DN42681_c0_g1~~TRINITY_DN42681_c0_g1_i1.p1  ORF type:complete len:280 (+),score=43.97 TRINITY_DN42681_c0_g1_i1:47-886(+)
MFALTDSTSKFKGMQSAATWQAAIDATIGAVFQDVADYLATRDVASWQAVNVETKEAFDTCYEDGTVWQNCAQSQFPQFFADEELYEGKDRHRLLRLHELLLRANYAPGCLLMLNTIEEVSHLECQFREALAFYGTHNSACGRKTHLLLGNFQLMQSATGTRFEFGAEDTPPIAGLPCGALKMTMYLDGDKLVTCAEYSTSNGFPFKPYQQANHLRFKLNVWSGDLEFALKFQGVTLALDGARRFSNAGQWTNKRAPHDSDERLPVLCVLTLTEEDQVS